MIRRQRRPLPLAGFALKGGEAFPFFFYNAGPLTVPRVFTLLPMGSPCSGGRLLALGLAQYGKIHSAPTWTYRHPKMLCAFHTCKND